MCDLVFVNGGFNDKFQLNLGVHQGSVLSTHLFIMVLEALSMEFRTGCPWELLYADDLLLIAESLEELTGTLKSTVSGKRAWNQKDYKSTWERQSV